MIDLDLLNIRLSYQYGIIEFDQYREMMANVRLAVLDDGDPIGPRRDGCDLAASLVADQGDRSDHGGYLGHSGMGRVKDA